MVEHVFADDPLHWSHWPPRIEMFGCRSAPRQTKIDVTPQDQFR